MARSLAAAIAVSLLAVSGAGAQTPKRGGTVRTTVRNFVLFTLINPLTNAENWWLER